MNLDLTETQRLLEETLAAFLDARVSFDRIRELEKEQGMDAALWSGLADQGFLALPFAESGRAQGGWIELGLLTEQLARKATLVPILEVSLVAQVLQAAPGGEAAKGVGAKGMCSVWDRRVLVQRTRRRVARASLSE